MKNECDIVQDLLFGYNDKTLQNTSKEFVENHLKECNECKEVLKQIQNDTEPQEEIEEINYFKKVRSKINRKNIFLIIALVLLAFVILFNILVFVNYNNKASEMKIVLKDNVTQEQLNDIEQIIKSNFKDVEIKYSSKEDELQKYKEKFKNFVAGYDENNNPFSDMYYIKANINDIEKIDKLLQNGDYIKQVGTYTTANPYLLFINEFINK